MLTPLSTGRSAWSRARAAYQVPDLPKEEAFTYLTKRGHSFEEAKEIYEFAGGRISTLKDIADLFSEATPWTGIMLFRLYVLCSFPRLTSSTEIQQRLKAEQINYLVTCQVYPDMRYFRIGQQLITTLMEQGSIPYEDFILVCAKSGLVLQDMDNLLASNVFVLNPATRSVTFHNKIIKRILTEVGRFHPHRTRQLRFIFTTTRSPRVMRSTGVGGSESVLEAA